MQGQRASGPSAGTRAYRSPRREAQARRTRRRIVAAATELFRTSGFGGTTMAGIARAAGVAVPTVELHFGTKAALLKVAIDTSIAGDDEPVPVLERPWVDRATAERTAGGFLRVVVEVLVAAAERSDALVLAAFDAARADDRLAPLAAQLKSQRAVTAGWIVDGLMSRVPLRPGVDRPHAVDTVWMLMEPAVFDRLTTDRGWSSARFGSWFVDATLRLLADAPT